MARKDGNLKIETRTGLLRNLDSALKMRAKSHSKFVLKGNTVSNPHQGGAATSLATKAIYMLFATVLLVFVGMLALTVLHP